MKKSILLILAISVSFFSLAQNQESSFKAGEWFKFKMSYSGFFKAGNATLNVSETNIGGKPVYHVVGKGWTTGAIKWFFKVEDRYESYFDKSKIIPYKFVRKIDEGGHTKDLEIKFDQTKNEALIIDKKHKTEKTVATSPNVQDMVSTFYYLRNTMDIETLKPGDEVKLDMFFDEESYGFKLKYLGKEVIKTEFGKVDALMFRPYVMAGRVFKEEESLTLWVSNDKNKIPLRIKADLAVGSLRADLEAYKGLSHPFKIIID
jgi:hypothetical protein|tara:strand:+ start:119 stop:901 length:783 start_codon:yes stop_codon:yes gene_type:complete